MKKIVILIAIVIVAVVWYQSALASRSDNNETLSFRAETGQGTSLIAKRLEKEKLIASSLAFKIYFYLHKDLTIKAGDYLIEPKTKTKDLIVKLSEGEVAENEVSVLIREGLTVKEINEYLKKEGFMKDDSFLRAAAAYEGYLFPDTYRMYKDFTAEDLISKMRANFEKKLTPELREAMNNSGHKPEDIIIMASILEKEVRTEEEMKIASGLFWDRLKVGQALQSCATLAFILGVNKPQYSYEDTQIVSPYNTYQHPGLPPGPVSNPGLKAIKAAIYPTKTDYNYFLARPDTGETIFSVTLEEHNAAKAKYLK